ncbi:MAG: hypothetical protein R3307_04305, partial [Anaerolineales bacterium]|nr:hypothetical protein [Anaerolineales bacterium]
MKTKNNISHAVVVGLFISLFGLPIIGMIIKNFPEETRSTWGLALIWVVTIALFTLIKYGEVRPYTSIGLSLITVKESLLAIGIGIVLSIS